jgi:signal transduction histidine kinase
MIVITTGFLPMDRIVWPSLTLMMTSAAVLLLGHLIVSEERLREMLNDSNRKLTEYAAQVEELATAKERNRLAREIHDNIGHYLTAVNMQIEAALAIMENDPQRARESLTKAQNLTKEGLAEIRLSVSALRSNPMDARPLHEAIELLVEEHRTSGLQVTYRVEGAIRPVSAAVEITLYRIAQEALTNIRKHAQATHADLILQYVDAQQVNLKINDNGSGSTSDKSTGFGLVGIQERLSVLGGKLNIQTEQGRGFALLAEIPT